ncbi:MAG: Gfo/Idh/MocA family oxidoreductase [Thermoflavifilum sp.]|nr:Gfo/Idh/MocA family oxidoreductase [Thermoflavifilum sp.]
MNRREFIRNSLLSSAAVSLSGISLASTRHPYRKIKVAVIGTNGRGIAHIEALSHIPDVDIAYICDVEQHALAKGVNAAEKLTNKRPKAVKDFRTVLDDKELDAITIATPDHWHALATLLACQAGKHVYVEKPCGHNPAEGELMIAAAQKYHRLVQMGNQRRSWPNIIEAVQLIHEGIIGKVYFGEGWYANDRKPIGFGKIVSVPSTLDWDLWQGPAPREDYRDNVVPYNWHWFWNWGTGEICNNGTHEIDCMRWMLQVDYPIKVSSAGGRYAYHDDWQCTDTQTASFEFPEGKAITWIGRSCNPYPIEHGGRGFRIYGEKGTLVNNGGDHYRIYDLDNHLIRESPSKPTPQNPDVINPIGPGVQLDLVHFQNFISAIRDGIPLHSPIEEGHISVLLCHLGNIAQRTQSTLICDPSQKGKIVNNEQAMALWTRNYQPGWELKV